MTPRRLYNFLIDPDLAEKLKEVKGAEGVPESELIRRALREYLARWDAEQDTREARARRAQAVLRQALADDATEADVKAARLARHDIEGLIRWQNRQVAGARVLVRGARAAERMEKIQAARAGKKGARKRSAGAKPTKGSR